MGVFQLLRVFRLNFILFSVFNLIACGGGGGGGGATDTSSYTIGGTVTGYTSSGMVLKNNNGDDLVISSNGEFTFSQSLVNSSRYNVTVSSQPDGLFCSVTNASGNLSGNNVTNITVDCVEGFTVGGSVNNMALTGLVLQNNQGDDLEISANGAFIFVTTMPDQSEYAVTVSRQPTGQICNVTNSTGQIAGSNIINVSVICQAGSYTIGGTVTGLTSAGLVLQNNNGDDLVVSAEGTFTFTTPVVFQKNYSVQIIQQPSGQGCIVRNPEGTVGSTNVTDIQVVCNVNLKAGINGALPQAVSVQGNYAYVAADGGFQIINISNASTPVIESFTNLARAVDLAVSGSYLYVTERGAGIRIYDITNPAAPLDTGIYPSLGYGVAVNGSYMYVTNGFLAMHIVDINNPLSPVLVGSVDPGGFLEKIVVSGNYAYTVDSSGGFQIIDASDPALPVKVGELPTLKGEDLTVSGTYAYVSAGFSLNIVDISNPALPTVTGVSSSPVFKGYTKGVSVTGNTAFLSASQSGYSVFKTIDITDPAAPVELAAMNTPGLATDVAISGSTAYVADNIGGFRVIDITDLSAPVELGFYKEVGAAAGVDIAGNYAYIAESSGGLRVADISNPASLLEVGEYAPASFIAFDVIINGGYAYVSGYEQGGSAQIFILDISNPIAPVKVGAFGSGGGIKFSGNFAYESSGTRLTIHDVSDPILPVRKGSMTFADPVKGIDVSGGYLYVAAGASGLRIIDVSDPDVPVEVGFLENQVSMSANGVAVNGSYVYMAGFSQFRVIDVSDLTAPVQVGLYPARQNLTIRVSGNYVYIGNSNLLILDISNPLIPILAGTYITTGRLNSMAIKGNLIYAADSGTGFKVLEFLNL